MGDSAPPLSQEEVDAAFAAASQEIAKRLAAASLASATPQPQPDASAADELANLDDVLDLDAALDALDATAEAAAAAQPEEQPKPSAGVSAELQEKIIKQVEFYFSDENLPTDEFLLKRVKQNKQGWVHLGVIARFHKMKKYCKGDWTVLGEALKASSKLEISPRGTHVRRSSPLPKVDLFEVAARTCVAENLPENPTAESVTRLFSAAGPVRMVRVCPPTAAAQSAKSTLQAAAQQAAELDPAGALAGALAVVSTQVHALVEFETEAAAHNAVRALNDAQNWRSGLRVRLVYKGSVHKTQQVTEGCDGPDPEGDGDGGEGGAAAGGGAQGHGHGQGEGEAKGKGRGKGREPKKNYAQWAAAGSYKQAKEARRGDFSGPPPGAARGPSVQAGLTSFPPASFAPAQREEREREASGAQRPAASGGEAGAAAGGSEGAAGGSGATPEQQRPRRFFIGAKGRGGGGDGGGAPGAAGAGGAEGAAAGAGGSGGPAREAKMPDGTRGFGMGRGARLEPPPIGVRAGGGGRVGGAPGSSSSSAAGGPPVGEAAAAPPTAEAAE